MQSHIIRDATKETSSDSERKLTPTFDGTSRIGSASRWETITPFAASVDEYRGTDDFIVRCGYLRKITSLPSGLEQGIYFAEAYEAGEMWSPERKAFLRQGFVGGVIASTPLAVITITGAIGGAGRRKVFSLTVDCSKGPT